MIGDKKNVCEDLMDACGSCWIFTLIFILCPIIYVITSIVCCVPMCCFNCCFSIIEFVNDKKNKEIKENEVVNVVKIDEVKTAETPLSDDRIYRPYTYSGHIEIQMTENPLHKIV